MPRENGERRLAIEVEDHPLEYLNFQELFLKEITGRGSNYLGQGLCLSRKDFAKNQDRIERRAYPGAYVLIKTGKEENQWLMVKYQ